jgi:crotonobetainyl-CoA:carnitine CoA-transferase CaiB-like acyl-CoA transferase
MSITGQADGPPMKVGVAVTDVIAGLQAAGAILAALIARERTGKGDRITVSLLGAAVAALVNVGQGHLLSGEAPRRWGNAHPHIVPYQAFAAADGYFTVAAGNDKQFGLLCALIGQKDLAADPRFATNPQRIAHREELIGVLEPIFRQKTTTEWLGALTAAGVPCGPVNSLPELFGGAQPPPGVEMLELQAATADRYRTVGPPAQMAGLRSDPAAAPLAGQHTDEVLRELLGLDARQIDSLRRQNAIA